MFRLTELEYLNERILVEEQMARNALLLAVRDVHAEMADRYRARRREKQVELAAKLRQRYPARLRPA